MQQLKLSGILFKLLEINKLFHRHWSFLNTTKRYSRERQGVFNENSLTPIDFWALYTLVIYSRNISLSFDANRKVKRRGREIFEPTTRKVFRHRKKFVTQEKTEPRLSVNFAESFD